ncbi:hypothetical protein pEaSNUABM9_00174 [Erwinia phage pEa_SNUABM_9]|nr:hypothetical protein pEaSNUABM9_00174 [Erwinia phage pEa_SNUABM_9]
MSQSDHFLLNAVRSLTNYERTRAGRFIHVGCPKELFDKFLAHGQLGPWLRRNFPDSLKMLKDWDSKPTRDERDARLDPYKVINDRFLAQRVIMYYTRNGYSWAEWVDWENNTNHIFEIEEDTAVERALPPGALMEFENPKTMYLESLFLHGTMPLYNHKLCIWLTEQVLEVLQTDVAHQQGVKVREQQEVRLAATKQAQ